MEESDAPSSSWKKNFKELFGKEGVEFLGDVTKNRLFKRKTSRKTGVFDMICLSILN